MLWTGNGVPVSSWATIVDKCLPKMFTDGPAAAGRATNYGGAGDPW